MSDLSVYRKVVLFGGSFDPPHVAHVMLSTLVMEALGADAVAYIPAGRSPFKIEQPQTAAKHRLAMLRLCTAHLPHAIVLTDEIEHLLARLADATLQQIAVWKMEGYSYDDMAVKLDCSKRTVIRKFKLIRQIAEAGE